MTYSPGSPGSSGYPPGSYGAPSPSYAPVADPGPSKLPHYLNIAVVLLGLGAYVAAFGPVFTASTNFGPFSVEATSTGGILLTLAAVLAALLAAIGLAAQDEEPSDRRCATGGARCPGRGRAAGQPAAGRDHRLGAVGGAGAGDPSGHRRRAGAAVRDGCAHPAGAQTPLRAAAVRPVRQHYGQYGAPGAATTTSRPAHPPPDRAARRRDCVRRTRRSTPAVTRRARRAGGYSPPGPQGSSQQGPPTPPTGYPSFSPPPAVGSGQHHANTDPNLGLGAAVVAVLGSAVRFAVVVSGSSRFVRTFVARSSS